RDLDRDRRQVEVRIILKERPDERRAAVNALGRPLAGLSEDDQNLVGRTAPISLEQRDKGRKKKKRKKKRKPPR
ncbi:hypothetical protein LJC31_05060, partial [Synergistaceae bacterium OttesenSCG-928-I11]|nr:hypothetical protein [Synergistaceae bacterium OttesenSCG-928-I11]